MAVLRITHLRGGDPIEMAAIAKDAKRLWEELGAEKFTYYRYETGARMGESLLIQRFTDWASMGKAMDKRATHKDYAATINRALKIAEIISVDYLTGIDL